MNIIKDPKMLQWFQNILILPEKGKEWFTATANHFIKAVKISCFNSTKNIYKSYVNNKVYNTLDELFNKLMNIINPQLSVERVKSITGFNFS